MKFLDALRKEKKKAEKAYSQGKNKAQNFSENTRKFNNQATGFEQSPLEKGLLGTEETEEKQKKERKFRIDIY